MPPRETGRNTESSDRKGITSGEALCSRDRLLAIHEDADAGMGGDHFFPVDDVINETNFLLNAGKKGGYILSPSHAVEGDAPIQNIIAFIEEAKNQKKLFQVEL